MRHFLEDFSKFSKVTSTLKILHRRLMMGSETTFSRWNELHQSNKRTQKVVRGISWTPKKVLNKNVEAFKWVVVSVLQSKSRVGNRFRVDFLNRKIHINFSTSSFHCQPLLWRLREHMSLSLPQETCANYKNHVLPDHSAFTHLVLHSSHLLWCYILLDFIIH